MINLVIFVVILLVDTLVFKFMVPVMAGDLDIDPPDFPESFKHCAIADIGYTIIRMAGINLPIHYIYFYKVFYNDYGLNRFAVFTCILVMGICDFVAVTAILIALGGAGA
ncbi:MAG: hypothetical protein ACQETH_09005 [Candidatus Rifleibacteriota bacterium]